MLAGCSRFDTLLYHPPQTPETWLAIQPFIVFHIASKPVVLVQPSTTFFVYALGILAVGFGLYFFRIRENQTSRLWWGTALLLWGIGALLAGTSYEAFSYQIKCAGRELCIWTSWWEIFYLVLSVASVDAMIIAGAYAGATGRWRRVLVTYAFLNLILYIFVLFIGSMIPSKFLISFEMLLCFTAPGILVLFILNGWRYYKLRQEKDLATFGIWIGLALVISAYFLYLIMGTTQKLWERGVWFSENDVLHIGLIAWMIYIILIAAKRINDEPVDEWRSA